METYAWNLDLEKMLEILQFLDPGIPGKEPYSQKAIIEKG